MKDPRIIKAIGALCEAFNRHPTPATFGAYEIGLAGLTAEQVERAAARALQRCKFMPVPAELRELAAVGDSSYESMAERAFHALTRAVQSLGPDCSVNFADGAINATVRLLGGWIRVCELPTEEFDKWFRRDFIATYCRVCRDGASESLRSYHGGRLERDNAEWDGVTLRSGLVYRLGDFGSGIAAVDADYQPALPSPEPKRLLSASREEFGMQLKRLPSP